MPCIDGVFASFRRLVPQTATRRHDENGEKHGGGAWTLAMPTPPGFPLLPGGRVERTCHESSQARVIALSTSFRIVGEKHNPPMVIHHHHELTRRRTAGATVREALEQSKQEEQQETYPRITNGLGCRAATRSHVCITRFALTIVTTTATITTHAPPLSGSSPPNLLDSFVGRERNTRERVEGAHLCEVQSAEGRDPKLQDEPIIEPCRAKTSSESIPVRWALDQNPQTVPSHCFGEKKRGGGGRRLHEGRM